MKYIFDMDGTLIDSMPAYCGAMINFLKRNNVEYPDNIMKIITPLGYNGSAEYFIKEFGVKKEFNEIIEEFKNDMLYEYTNTIPAKPFVEETLKRLKKEGVGLNVLTASPHCTLDPCLKRLGLYDLFDNVWSSEDFGLTKSDVNIYYQAAEKLGAETKDCIFLDDNYNAILTAKEAGMHVYGVFDESSSDYT